jgi:hypothetical protein
MAALFALVAFSAYYAEGVLAIFCVTDSPHHEEMTVSHAAGDAHAAGAHEAGTHWAATDGAGADAAPTHAAGTGTAPAEGSHTSQCPLGMGGGVTCAPASVPAVAAAMLPTPASAERAVVPAEFNIQLLLAGSLYHPPRA